jgi:tRNA (guanine37-N1)-methyltransferase
MRIDILTLFPGIFRGFLDESLLRLARENGIVEVHLWDIRDYTEDKHRKVDDRPYGGGPGMVMMPGPVFAAAEAANTATSPPARTILLSPQGRTFCQPIARELALAPRLLLICGRYEGFDERVHEVLANDAICLGPFVLAGGEVAAMAVVDAVARKLAGALGNPESLAAESFSEALGGGLEHPHYTRPAVFLGHEVPAVLVSGDHGAIARWRAERILPPRAA